MRATARRSDCFSGSLLRRHRSPDVVEFVFDDRPLGDLDIHPVVETDLDFVDVAPIDFDSAVLVRQRPVVQLQEVGLGELVDPPIAGCNGHIQLVAQILGGFGISCRRENVGIILVTEHLDKTLRCH